MDILKFMALPDRVKLNEFLNETFFWIKYNNPTKYTYIISCLIHYLTHDISQDELHTLTDILYYGDYIHFMRDLRAEIQLFLSPDTLINYQKYDLRILIVNRYSNYRDIFKVIRKKEEYIYLLNVYFNNINTLQKKEKEKDQPINHTTIDTMLKTLGF